MKIVSIVGRPNVGKSTLFNRLTDEGDAITHDIRGTTRDRNYGQCVWNGFEFTVIDTGEISTVVIEQLLLGTSLFTVIV